MEKQEIIMAAINSVDAGVCKTEAAYEKAVAKRALTINRLLSENSLASRLLDAVRLYGKVSKVEFEKSSNRYKIYFVADNSESRDEEMIRTDRIDGGCIMTKEFIEALPGWNVCIYKINEANDNKRVGAGYRIAPMIERISK